MHMRRGGSRRFKILVVLATVVVLLAAVVVLVERGSGPQTTGKTQRLATGVSTTTAPASSLGTASTTTLPANGATTPVGSAPSLPAGSVPIGPVPSTQTVSIDIGLKPRNQDDLTTFIAAVSDPNSPQYRQYLGKGQFAARFGPTAQTIDDVRAYLGAQGFTVGPVSADGLTIPAKGTAAQVEAALSTQLEKYRLADGSTAFANVEAPSLPTLLATGTNAVLGLSTLNKPRPLSTAPSTAKPLNATTSAQDSSPTAELQTNTAGPNACHSAQNVAGTWTADQLAAAYGFTSAYGANRTGAGQTIALFELASFSQTDVTTFENCYFPGRSFPPTSVTDICSPGPCTGDPQGNLEVTLDIEDALSLAPGATIHVYEGPDSNTTTDADIDAVYQKMETDDSAKVVSTSWGSCEPSTPPQLRFQENVIFQAMAAQGQTVLAAAGDSGSEGCSTDSLAVDDPASQPYVTGVGGTSMTADAPGSPTETTWNTVGGGAGGGGVSTIWPRPSWQVGPGTGTGTAREVPDVSASADPNDGYTLYYQGNWMGIGGTSAAAPLWAALVAVANQGCSGSLGFLNPLLYANGTAGGSLFHDITIGNNDSTGTNAGQYGAAPGYDMATGWGSPNGSYLTSSACFTHVNTLSTAATDTHIGATATYTTPFTTSASGALQPGGTITLASLPGTVFPASSASYTVTAGGIGVALGTVNTHATPLSTTPNVAVITIAAAIASTTPVVVTVVGITNPQVLGDQTVSVATAADQASTTASPFALLFAPASSATVVTLSPNTAVVGQAVTYHVSVTASRGIPTGTVAVSSAGGSVQLCTATLSNGSGACSAGNAAVGADLITAQYEGDANTATSQGTTTLTVNQAGTAVGLNIAVGVGVGGPPNQPVTYPVTYTAAITVTAPGTGNPSGQVTFTSAGVPIAGCSPVTVSTGGGSGSASATCAVSSPNGVLGSIVASYSGDGSFLGSSSPSFTEQLVSPNGQYYAVVQSDGNFVVYTYSGQAVWSTGTYGTSGNSLSMQTDGNLVLYGTSGALWSSTTFSTTANTLTMQNDGNLVLYSPTEALWSSKYGLPSTMTTGQSLGKGNILFSPNGQYRAILQTDGNFVVYALWGAIWSTATFGTTGSSLVLQSDGNLVLYGSGGGALWSSRTFNTAADVLTMQNDGNLVLYSPTAAVWSSRFG
jgi:Pro-kumamolisin, activation domain/Bacterial Ig-like domain (group 3)